MENENISNIEKYISAIIADDNESARKIARYFLSKESMDIIEVSSGVGVVSRVCKQPLDLLILDWKMPQLAGPETLKMLDKILLESNQTNTLYVIVYSSSNLESLILPLSTRYSILGYINKSWALDVQKKKFDKMIEALNKKLRISSAA